MHRQSRSWATVESVVVLLCVVALCGCAAATATKPPAPAPSATALPTSKPSLTPVPPPPTAAPTEAVATPTQPAVPTVPAEPPAATAQYQLVFEATWAASTHPTDFPSNPHFSGLIGAAHSDSVRLWAAGEAATPGIKNMAETGGKSPLSSEIDALISSGSACVQISGGGINPSPGTAKVTFSASQKCPVVSVVSMIAPSPDWFVGVSGLRLFEDGGWVERKVVVLFAYDAGTDSGPSYASANDPMAVPEAIHKLEATPVLIDGSLPLFGTFTFTRLHN